MHTKAAFGTAEGLIDCLTQLQEELGLNGIVAELNPGGLIPSEQVKRSLNILTHRVMPAFKYVVMAGDGRGGCEPDMRDQEKGR